MEEKKLDAVQAPREETPQKERKIKNRDIPPLSRILYVMQDICSLEKRYDWQSERLYNVTQRLSWTHGGGGGKGGFDAIYAAMDEINEECQEQMQTYLQELKTAEKIINSIPSRTMKTFVTMMYVDNIPPEKVRQELNMTKWGFRMARDCVEQAKDMQSVKWREKYILQERKNF